MNLKWIEKEAQTLLREYAELTGWKMEEPPVPVSLIAEICYDATISYEEMEEEIAGQLFVSERLIRINAKDSPERQNFTIGHELGHLRLHVCRAMGQLSLFDEESFSRQIICRRNDTRIIEREANAFSVNLLMPRGMVIREYRRVLKLMRSIPVQQKVEMMYDERWRDAYLARKFEVSLEAMRFRLMNLKLIDDGKLNYSLQAPQFGRGMAKFG